MTCSEWQTQIEAYVDSELPERVLAEFEPHLRACPSCSADALGRLQMKRMTQAAGARYAPTPQFRRRVEQSIRAKHRPLWISGWIPRLAMAVVAILLLVAAAGLWVRRAEHEQALTELADLHVAAMASANPVDVVSTDRHTVKPWFAGKLPFTFNLPELQGSPFKLVGGRMTYFERSPGAQLLFDAGKHRISVFIFEDRSGLRRLGSGSSTTKNEFHVETWTERGLRFFVISDAESAAVHELSKLLQSAEQS